MLHHVIAAGMFEDFTSAEDWMWFVLIFGSLMVGAISGLRKCGASGATLLHGLWMGPMLLVLIAAAASGLFMAICVIALVIGGSMAVGARAHRTATTRRKP